MSEYPTYRVEWSAVEAAWEATPEASPGLSWRADSPLEALAGLLAMVKTTTTEQRTVIDTESEFAAIDDVLQALEEVVGSANETSPRPSRMQAREDH